MNAERRSGMIFKGCLLLGLTYGIVMMGIAVFADDYSKATFFYLIAVSNGYGLGSRL